MSRSDNPVYVNKWSSTDVATVDSEGNLPWPGMGLGIFPIYDPTWNWSISTTCEVKKWSNKKQSKWLLELVPLFHSNQVYINKFLRRKFECRAGNIKTNVVTFILVNGTIRYSQDFFNLTLDSTSRVC